MSYQEKQAEIPTAWKMQAITEACRLYISLPRLLKSKQFRFQQHKNL